jgi:hypothetical protein
VTSQKLPRSHQVSWDKTFRLIPSRYPPIDLFERIADPADWEMLAAIEGLTNDRLRDEIGQIGLVPPMDRIAGPGASPIMAAFTHVGFASRFTDGSYGVYYASDQLAGAIKEVVHHQEMFLRRTSEPATHIQMRLYVGSISAELHDVRGGWPAVHDPVSYLAAQKLALSLRKTGSNGIVYDSVRFIGVSNVAVFRPRVLASPSGKAHVKQGEHIQLEWNGTRIFRFIKVGERNWQSIDSLKGPPS